MKWWLRGAFVPVWSCWLLAFGGTLATYSNSEVNPYDVSATAYHRRLAPLEDLCHIGNGLYPHPNDCAKFIHCSNLAAYIKDCGPGTVFNSELLVCDWPKNVDCTDRHVHQSAQYVVTTAKPYHRPPPEPYHPELEPYRPKAIRDRPYYGEMVLQPRMTDIYDENYDSPAEDRFAVETVRPSKKGALARAFAIDPPPSQTYNHEAQVLKTKTRLQHSPLPSFTSTTAKPPHVDVEYVHPPIVEPESAAVPLPGPKLDFWSANIVEHPPNDDIDIEGSMRILDSYMQEKRSKNSPANHLIPIYDRNAIKVFNTEQNANIHGAGKVSFITEYHPSNQTLSSDALRVLPISEALKLLLHPYVKTNNSDAEQKATAQMKENLIENQMTANPVAAELSEYDDSNVLTRSETNALDVEVHEVRGEPYAQSRVQSEDESAAKTRKKWTWNSLSDHEQQLKQQQQQNVKTKNKFSGHSSDIFPAPSDRVVLSNDHVALPAVELPAVKLPAVDSLFSFDCGNGENVKSHQQCDGRPDCKNGKDEIGCFTDCSFKFDCGNGICTSLYEVCDGKNDCANNLDEQDCSHVGYEVRLSAGDLGRTNIGRVEVKVYDQWGYVCDNTFDMAAATVVCRELGFPLGAVEIRRNTMSLTSANVSVSDAYMMDGLQCNGNETSLKHCDFKGWGVHNCSESDVAGVVCKVPPTMACLPNYWLCDRSEECIHNTFICDGVKDCSDGSDEVTERCTAPLRYRLANDNMYGMEGRAEIQYKGIWGTVCDDDFGATEAQVFCRSLGYDGPANITTLPLTESNGPIWLDQVSCKGHESNIADCLHFEFGTHNCNHSEDIAVHCSHGTQLRMTAQLQMPTVTTPMPRTGRNENDLQSYDDGTCGTIKVSFPHAEASEQMLDRAATKGYHPWQASVRVKGSNGKSFHWCGAVLVGRFHLLTAAHCLNGYMKGAYVVRVGDHFTNMAEESEREMAIDSWHIHEHFRKGQRANNDIALIRTKMPVTFGEFVQPICLPVDGTVYTPGRNCSFSGWGSKSTPTKELRVVEVSLVSSQICRQPEVYGSAITEGMVCAGSEHNADADACDGDSGGPLACTEHDGTSHLYGLISWGQRCGTSKKPGVYVKVAHYLPWIREKMVTQNSSTGVKH